MESPRSRRAFLTGGALSLASLAGCTGVSAPLPNSLPASVDRDADRNDNDCADGQETFSVTNERDEQATIHVTVVHEQNGETDGQNGEMDGQNGETDGQNGETDEHDGEDVVFDGTFRVPADGSRIAREPVFSSGLGTYRIEATHEQYRAERTIDGVPCHTRRNRVVGVTLDQYGSLGIDVEWA